MKKISKNEKGGEKMETAVISQDSKIENIQKAIEQSSCVGFAYKPRPFAKLQILLPKPSTICEVLKVDTDNFCKAFNVCVSDIYNLRGAKKFAAKINKPIIMFEEEDTYSYRQVRYILPDNWNIFKRTAFRIKRFLRLY